MKELMRFEFNKSIRKPIVLIVFAGILLVDILMVLYGTFGDESTIGMPYSREKVIQLQQEQSSLSGVIDEEWMQRINGMQQAILNDSDNMVSEEKRKIIIENLLAEGLSKETIESSNYKFFFLREDVLMSRQYNRLEDPLIATMFYQSADKEGKEVSQNYLDTYDGEKGEALASKAKEMYHYLSSEYKAYYDYSWGWSRLHAIQTVLPFTIGLLLIVVLSPIFSWEYGKKTDSIILSTKYGKNKLIKVKIVTGFIIAILSWLFIQLINMVIIFSLFGIEGSQAFVQNWAVNPSPYAFNHLTSYIAVTVMSFIGLLFLTSTILFISSRSKSTFISLVMSAVITLLPTVPIDIFAGRIVQNVLMFLPTTILIGLDHFKTFNAFYIFDKVIILPIVVLVFAVILTICMTIGAYFSFKQHQVEN